MKTTGLTLSFIFLFISVLSTAQKRFKGNGDLITQERSIGDFNQLLVKGPFKVELTSQFHGEITLNTDANLMDEIVTEIKDNTLIIRLKKQSYLKPSNRKSISIKAPLTAMNKITHAGSGTIYASESFTTQDLQITHSGSGKIELAIEAQNTTVNLSGSGKIQLSGRSQNLSAKLSGSGNLRLANLVAKNGEVKLSGSGNIGLSCTESLMANILCSENVRYKGDPSKKLITKVSGSGSIRQMNWDLACGLRVIATGRRK